MAFTTPLVGANPLLADDTPRFKPGHSAMDDQNRTWVYAGPLSGGALAAAATCTLTGALALTNVAGNYTTDSGLAVGQYGWVRKTASPL